ncbi:hypothetical protein NR798_31580 [Archangium gephyra]|uniref:hypothetical protein n=1 Tax=Archangium gephyra TaxID=48 RepID=UPI0035D4B143
MNKLLPLLTLATTVGCGPSVIDVSLKELPSPVLRVELETELGDEMVVIDPEQEDINGSCHRVPDDTRLTVNGTQFKRESRGDNVRVTQGYHTCIMPWFTGPRRPVDETRSEFIVSDGETQMRAVFQSLRAVRRFQVNGQEQATLRGGQDVDLEWFPATDRLETPTVTLRAEGSTNDNYYFPQVEGAHMRFTLGALPPGRYVLSLTEGTAHVGVESCEGFTACEAPLFLNGISASVVIE